MVKPVFAVLGKRVIACLREEIEMILLECMRAGFVGICGAAAANIIEAVAVSVRQTVPNPLFGRGFTAVINKIKISDVHMFTPFNFHCITHSG